MSRGLLYVASGYATDHPRMVSLVMEIGTLDTEVITTDQRELGIESLATQIRSLSTFSRLHASVGREVARDAIASKLE